MNGQSNLLPMDGAWPEKSEVVTAQESRASAGTIAGGAGFVKDSVVGLVGGGQAGDTSELIAAMESKEASAPSAVGYESASTEPQSQSATKSTGPIGYESAPVGYESAPVGYESADAGPITQSTTRNEAGPVEFEDSESPQKPRSAAKSSMLYEVSSSVLQQEVHRLC